MPAATVAACSGESSRASASTPNFSAYCSGDIHVTASEISAGAAAADVGTNGDMKSTATSTVNERWERPIPTLRLPILSKMYLPSDPICERCKIEVRRGKSASNPRQTSHTCRPRPASTEACGRGTLPFLECWTECEAGPRMVWSSMKERGRSSPSWPDLWMGVSRLSGVVMACGGRAAGQRSTRGRGLQGEGAGAQVVWSAVVTVFRVGAGSQAVGSAAGHPSIRPPVWGAW